MSISDALLRVFRLSKSFIIIAKRCSSTTLHLLRYLFLFCNVFVQKWKRKCSLDNADNAPASKLPIVDAGRGKQAEACTGVWSAAMLSPESGGSALGHELTSLGSSMPEVELSDVERRPRSDGNRPAAHGHYPPTQTRPQRMRRSNPLLRNFRLFMPLSKMFLVSVDISNMVASLDRFRYVSSALAATQVGRQTDVDKWEAFSETFQKEVDTSNLLATVLLAANVGFLAIQSIDQEGLSYWPQRLSYMSLFSALGGITMGLAVRTPRFFTAHSGWYFFMMEGCLHFPFALLLYSFYFFIASLLVHLSNHAAIVQLYWAIAVIGLLAWYLTWYALLTEPQGIHSMLYWLRVASSDEEASSAE